MTTCNIHTTARKSKETKKDLAKARSINFSIKFLLQTTRWNIKDIYIIYGERQRAWERMRDHELQFAHFNPSLSICGARYFHCTRLQCTITHQCLESFCTRHFLSRSCLLNVCEYVFNGLMDHYNNYKLALLLKLGRISNGKIRRFRILLKTLVKDFFISF